MKDGPCYYCGELTNSLIGNPSEWPLGFPHIDDPGVVKPHHVKCVLQRLKIAEENPNTDEICRLQLELESIRQERDSLKSKLNKYEFEEQSTKKKRVEKLLGKEIQAVDVNEVDDPDWPLWHYALSLINERHAKYELVNLAYYLLLKAKGADDLRRYNQNVIQDRCEGAYIEVSHYDAALQALAEAAPKHPLLKEGAAPSYGVWASLRYQLDEATALAEKLTKAIEKHRTATGHEMCWENDVELWKSLNDGVELDHTPPSWCEFMTKCAAYRASKDT